MVELGVRLIGKNWLKKTQRSIYSNFIHLISVDSLVIGLTPVRNLIQNSVRENCLGAIRNIVW